VDDRVFDAVVVALRHADPDVRRSAANAAGLLAWPEFAEPLHDLAGREQTEEVRLMAERALLLCSPATR
jgi:hypothetical protein